MGRSPFAEILEGREYILRSFKGKVDAAFEVSQLQPGEATDEIEEIEDGVSSEIVEESTLLKKEAPLLKKEAVEIPDIGIEQEESPLPRAPIQADATVEATEIEVPNYEAPIVKKATEAVDKEEGIEENERVESTIVRNGRSRRG